MQFFNTLCEIHKGKFLFEKSMKKYMKKKFGLSLSHMEMICLQYLLHNSGISLYDLSKLSGVDHSQLSQIVKKLDGKELVRKDLVSELPVKLSLSLTSLGEAYLESYRKHMSDIILDFLGCDKELESINNAISDYHSIVLKLQRRIL